MIKLLQYLAVTLKREDLYNLAMFLSENPDIIDQETLMHIVDEVDGWNSNNELYREEHNKLIEDKKLKDLLRDNNINLN
jgi:hypothetical protein|tara:strand:+ start:2440 stop:2676 length:237 start_codon:yes stop_codon:yes gene_type:complete